MFPKPGNARPEPKMGRPSANCWPDGTRLIFRITGRRLPRVNRYVAVSERSLAISRVIDTFAFKEYRLATSGLTVVMSWRVEGKPGGSPEKTVGNSGANGNCGVALTAKKAGVPLLRRARR